MPMYVVKVWTTDEAILFKYVSDIQIKDGFLIIAYITPQKNPQIRYINKDIIDHFLIEEM